MRLGIVAAATVVAVIGFTPVAEANVDKLAANVCNYVEANDKTRLRKRLKESRLKMRNVYDKISCDGKSLLRFAMTNNSTDVGTFLVKKVSKVTLAAAENDGTTVLDWANANGFGGSEIANAISTRIN